MTPNDPIFNTLNPFSYLAVGRDKDFKFGRQVKLDSRKSWPKDDNTSLKGAWTGHVNHLNFGGHQPYLNNG